MLKAGWRTTEFWITALANAALLIGCVAGMIPAEYAALAAAVADGLYAVSRELAKRSQG